MPVSSPELSISISIQSLWCAVIFSMLTSCSSVCQPSTGQSLYQSVTFLPNSTFHRLMRGFHRTTATAAACWQGTHTPLDTWSRPILGLAYVLLVETNPFLEPVVMFFRTMHFEHPFVLSRFCLSCV